MIYNRIIIMLNQAGSVELVRKAFQGLSFASNTWHPPPLSNMYPWLVVYILRFKQHSLLTFTTHGSLCIYLYTFGRGG